MEAWLAEHELEHTALPFLDRYELLPWYAACDFIAIPSFYDGLPNVLVEAAALGVPLIASRVDGMADVLTDGETALPVRPGRRAARGVGAAARRPAGAGAAGADGGAPAGRSPAPSSTATARSPATSRRWSRPATAASRRCDDAPAAGDGAAGRGPRPTPRRA